MKKKIVIFENFGIDFPKDVDELEYTVMNKMQKVYLTDEVKETLEELQNVGVRMFILSNSIFTINSTKYIPTCRVDEQADYCNAN